MKKSVKLDLLISLSKKKEKKNQCRASLVFCQNQLKEKYEKLNCSYWINNRSGFIYYVNMPHVLLNNNEVQ